MNKKSKVILLPCSSYREEIVYENLEIGLELLGGIENIVGKEESVLLKPNLLKKAEVDKAVITHPTVVGMFARLMREKGYQDMALAVQELIRTQGGYTLIADHKVFDTLELPVMGLMSDAGFRYSHIKLKRMIEKAHEMGVPDGIAPFITLSFMALPVIPEIRITPRGIYDVCTGEFYKY